MIEANKAAARKILKAIGSGDAEGLKPLVTDDLVVTARGYAKVSGARNHQVAMAAIAAFPQFTVAGFDFRVLHLTAEEDRVACEVEGFSTMKDGREYNNHYHFLMFFREGKLYKMHEYLDTQLADAVLGEYLLPGTK